jgi:GNAT superfamily N-acetyltransferase
MDAAWRDAVAGDVARIVELAEQLRAAMLTERGGALWAATIAAAPPLDAHFAALVDRPDTAALVGTIDDQVVGYGTARVEVLRGGRRLGVVDEVYVEPEAREVSVGEVLLDALCDWCLEQRCDGIDAVALPGDRTAKNFFEAHGFTARLLTMHHATTLSARGK